MSEHIGDFEVIFEDHHLLVVNKPAALLTQAPAHIPSLEALVKSYIKQKYQKPAGVYLGVPHRLDRPVSGVICFTKNSKASRRVHEQFEKRTVKKVYWALVEGELSTQTGLWEDWIKKIPENARVVKVDEVEEGAKQAVLNFQVLNHEAGTSLIELQPVTGRMHQLRAQCAWRGHPILGDGDYGSVQQFGPPAQHERDRVIALHARGLEIDHPFSQNRMRFRAELPVYWPMSSRNDSRI